MMEAPDEDLSPRGPWSYLRETRSGGFRRNGLAFILAWVAFQVAVPSLWAVHLRRLVGNSALPHYWGERITAREIHEILQNGGLQQAWTGFWMPTLGIITLYLVLWFGWRIQTEELGIKARWKPWGLGILDALAIGLVPLGAVTWLLLQLLDYLGGTGIQGLGWLALLGHILAPLCLGSTLMVQWWICRLARAAEPDAPYGRHLWNAMLCLWTRPFQWSSLVLGGVVIRLGLHAIVLLLAWRWGGGSTVKVWTILIAQGLATAINAWLIGWFMRLVARLWRRETRVRQAISDLKRDFG
ncbi:hypothetical protein [Holophaga foetida]|uniref:hypothetical protein n=1 Tax=Holophaga foetida TaxID=35839 RepID=UPI0002474D38|nr:hypothetical protein [Holophaga foetida]